MNKTQNERQAKDTQKKDCVTESADDAAVSENKGHKSKAGKQGAKGGAVLGEINGDAKKNGGTNSST